MLKDWTKINWDDSKEKVSQYFTVKEMLYLPSWDIYHRPSDSEKQNLCKLAHVMDKIRDFLGYPVHVNCAIRPQYVNCNVPMYNGKSYNGAVGGAPGSAHVTGEAMDFYVSSIVADEVRYLLRDELEKFDIYVEWLDKSNWTHVQIRPTKSGNRYFKP